MSVFQFPEHQVWNNAAFDNGDSEDSKSCSDFVSGKENKGSLMENQMSSVSSSVAPLKPVNGDVSKSRIRVLEKGFAHENIILKKKEFRDEMIIDKEIQEIESEISRLNSKLEGLRIEKAEKSLKALEKRGKIVSSKFMDQKENVKKKVEENSSLSSRTKVERRGLSMGPSEIYGAVKSKQFTTPGQNRRRSCFMKLQDIEEEKGKSLSLSPKSRKLATKNQFQSRQAVTTASKRIIKKEDGVINSVQPKRLFKDGEKSKPLRPGRVIASRYSQITNQTSTASMRKRSLPENDKDDGKRCDKKRSLSIGKSHGNDNESKTSVLGTENRVKKRWEIPSEIVVHCSEDSPTVLPRIRIGRVMNDSPRDSGAAKRVVELVGKKSFFAINEEEDEPSVCHALSYAEEGDEES